jgi:dolichol-phosphate mannosyltransferase
MASKYNNHSLGIIIPMFNEERGASACIDAVMRVVAKQQVVKNFIVVDDGSTDTTLTILKEKLKKYKNKLVIIADKKNVGYGGALQKGIKKALSLNLEYILFMDSDLTNDPKYIVDFIKEMPNGYDCVKASRYIKDGKMKGVPLKRKIFSYVGSFVSRSLFRIGIRDCTNGFRMVKLLRLENIGFKENNFSIILEELYYLKKMHATFFEIPTILTSRKEGKTHFTYKPGLLFDYLKYSCRALFI